MLLERIAAGTGQLDGLANRDAAMLAGKFNNFQRELRQGSQAPEV